MIAYRFATAEDIASFYEGRAHPTLRAVIVTLDGAPSAIVGLAREGLHAKFFSEYKPEFAPHLKAMSTLRAIKLAMSFVADSRLEVFAVADDEEPDSHRVLTRLGFVHEEEDLYRWVS